MSIMQLFRKKLPKHLKKLLEENPYDPELQVPVLMTSICTGEQRAGFRNKKDGHFTEVMLIRTEQDLNWFLEMYHLEEVQKEY